MGFSIPTVLGLSSTHQETKNGGKPKELPQIAPTQARRFFVGHWSFYANSTPLESVDIWFRKLICGTQFGRWCCSMKGYEEIFYLMSGT
jgi:hypothetical protein